MRIVRGIPKGIFKGANFMTPNLVSYWYGTYQGRTAYVELSQGKCMSEQDIWGVTIKNSNGALFSNPDPSRCFQSKQEAIEYINAGLTMEVQNDSQGA